MNKAKISLEFLALFFPKTMQAEFEKEQKRLRKLFEKESAALFSFFPPCIPFEGKITAQADTSLAAGPIKAKEGWLYRPAAFFPETAGKIPAANTLCISQEGNAFFSSAPANLKFPDEGALILGFAGDFAQAILEKALTEQGAEASFSATLKVKTWYCAKVSLLVAEEKNATLAYWSECEPLWKKRGAPFEWPKGAL